MVHYKHNCFSLFLSYFDFKIQHRIYFQSPPVLRFLWESNRGQNSQFKSNSLIFWITFCSQNLELDQMQTFLGHQHQNLSSYFILLHHSESIATYRLLIQIGSCCLFSIWRTGYMFRIYAKLEYLNYSLFAVNHIRNPGSSSKWNLIHELSFCIDQSYW